MSFDLSVSSFIVPVISEISVMKKQLLTSVLAILALSASSQIPEDLLKYSWQPVNGTARINAIGGAMGSLGGDITAIFTNPAGLAFYKTGDLVLSPGYNFLKNKSNFRGTSFQEKDKFFNLGPTGVVGGLNGNGNWTNKAISFAVNRTANFSNKIAYGGQNDFSSFGEQYAVEAANSGLNIGDILNSNLISIGTKMAVYSFLVDTATIGGRPLPDFVSLSMLDNLRNGAPFLVNQAKYVETSGGITELAFGYAANMDDKVYIGGSIGVPIVKYEKRSSLIEQDATGNTDNDFDFAQTTETFTTKGVGVNVKLGVIVKPADYLRLGLAVHSPTFYGLDDTYQGMMEVNLENYRSTPGTTTVTSDIFTDGRVPKYQYSLTTPWRFMLSGSYVLREIADIREQKGFITADLEYVTYKGNRFANGEDTDDGGYYHRLNDVVKSYYKNSVNFRIGGELKFTTIMTRLGFAYYGNPYSDKELKANKMFISGGLGYRNAGMFIDVTYVYGLQKDVDFPYRLPDKANTFANTKSNGGNLMLTLGFKI